ncbi:MAG: M28 family peptidase [Terrimonas sp.]|nr:M28 family peptidase [Terrimonas sp.]
MKKMLILACIALPVFAIAQKKNKTAEKIAKSISATDLKERLYTVASKENEGRDTPSPGLERAADYIENQFKSFGLLPGNGDSYRLRYPVYKDSMISASLMVNEEALNINKDFQPLSGVNHTAAMSFSELVFAGYGITDDKTDNYANLDVQGKLVMILDGSPESYPSTGQQRYRSPASSYGKLITARNKGVAALIIVSGNLSGNSGNGRSQWSLNGYSPSVFPLTFTLSASVAKGILGEDAKDLVSKTDGSPAATKPYKANISLSYYNTIVKGSASNVLGVVEGSDKKDEWVIITAHYDHLGVRNDNTYYGADDDGSGTVSVLEIAQAFAGAKAAGKGPRRSILFMTVSGEEHGLWGSGYYANHPVYPLEKTSADLNIDMVGRIGNEYQKNKDSANYIYIIGDDKLSSDLNPITEQVNKTYTKLTLDRKYNDPKDPNRFYYRSDHYNFAEKGVPIIFYFNGVHQDYHRPTDTPDKINYPLMEKRARLVFFTAWDIANRDEMLKRDKPLNQ